MKKTHNMFELQFCNQCIIVGRDFSLKNSDFFFFPPVFVVVALEISKIQTACVMVTLA